MKRLRLITMLSAFTLAAAGALGLVNVKEKTVDRVDADTYTKLYVNDFGWENFSFYLYGTGGNNGAFPGQAFTNEMKTSTPNEYDEYQFEINVNTTKYQTLILSGHKSGWQDDSQTRDLVISEMGGNGIHCGSQIPNTANFEVGYYTYSTKTVYMLDLKGDVYNTNHYCHTFASGKSGTSWPGVEMTKVSGQNNLYSAEINSVLDNVIFNNYGTKQTATISSVANGDAYIVYPDNGYNKTDLDASSFIDKYMKFETKWLDNNGDGSCKSAGWYSSAKSAFSGKTAAQKSKILEHEPTQYRLAAWATANEETFNTSNGTFSNAPKVLPVTNLENTNTIAIIVIISLVSVTAIGGYFFIKKRQEN